MNHPFILVFLVILFITVWWVKDYWPLRCLVKKITYKYGGIDYIKMSAWGIPVGSIYPEREDRNGHGPVREFER